MGVRLTKRTGDDSRLVLNTNYTFFGDLTPGGDLEMFNFATARGNAMNGTEFASDFGILDVIASFYTGNLVFSGEVINNLRAADGLGNTGFSLGAAMTTEWGRFYYSLTEIEQDAIMTLVSQDDTLLPTNYTTHVVGWSRPFGEGMVVQLYTLISEPKDLLAGYADATVYRIRFDVTISF
jgi:hypothetical protein